MDAFQVQSPRSPGLVSWSRHYSLDGRLQVSSGAATICVTISGGGGTCTRHNSASICGSLRLFFKRLSWGLGEEMGPWFQWAEKRVPVLHVLHLTRACGPAIGSGRLAAEMLARDVSRRGRIGRRRSITPVEPAAGGEGRRDVSVLPGPWRRQWTQRLVLVELPVAEHYTTLLARQVTVAVKAGGRHR